MIGISIHASREGCDFYKGVSVIVENVFQSTHPARDATRSRKRKKGRTKDFNPRIPRGMRRSKSNGFSKSFVISIHASREGCDDQYQQLISLRHRFQSTHPARDATSPGSDIAKYTVFQSTHPARDATLSSCAA